MTLINQLLEGVDLTGVHTVLALAGALLAVYVMQKTRFEAEDRVDPAILRHFRTFALGLLSMALLWTLTYSETRQWQPWPPEVLAIAAIDMLLACRALAIMARIRRSGRYYDAPSAARVRELHN